MQDHRSSTWGSSPIPQPAPRVAVAVGSITGTHHAGEAASARPASADDDPLPASLVSDLRTDHAGETGAVMIYRGILATTRDAAVRRFANGHLATEAAHLAAVEELLEPRHHSRLLPLWRGAGWLTGALPALIGPRAVYATIEAVETFVDQHYSEQIDAIDRLDPCRAQASLQVLRAHLNLFRADEIEHRDDAAARFGRCAAAPFPTVPLLRLWTWAVGAGSRGAVKICRWI